MDNRKCIIVSGATGFVGRHLIPLLLDAGYRVIATAPDETKAHAFDWCENVTFIPWDYHSAPLDIDNIEGAGLIHLAWQGLPNYQSLFHFETNLPHNYNFIKSLVAKGVRHVLAIGTCAEYGFQSGPLESSTPAAPANPYAMAKDALRQQLSALAQSVPFKFQWARLFYTYGEGQNQASILPQLDAAIANGDTVFNMSGGEQLRDYLDIKDVARQLLDIFQDRACGTYNICSGDPISLRRLVERHISKKKSDIVPNLGFYPYPTHEPMAFWGVRDIGQTFYVPTIPNSPLASKQQQHQLGAMRLRYNEKLRFLENEAFDQNFIEYNDDYQNSQAFSPRFIKHMKGVLELLRQTLPTGGHIVEVGCGKGDFVDLVKEDGFFSITGYDAAYEGHNPDIQKRYLQLSDRIKADIVVLRHVLEHIKEPHKFLEMFPSIFGDSKIYIEVPSYEWIAQNGTFFDITYEHANYFTQYALRALFQEGQSEGGLFFDGQYQYVIADLKNLTPDFKALYASHWRYPSFDSLFPGIEKTLEQIETQLQGGSLFLWGAATKGCLFLAHCQARHRIIDRVKFAVDINPQKINKFLPGSGILIQDKNTLFKTAQPGDMILIANPAYQAEIEKDLQSHGMSGLKIVAL